MSSVTLKVFDRILHMLGAASAHGCRTLHGASMSALSHFAGASYIREEIRGDIDLAAARRVAVMVHYDRGGILHDFFLYFLRQLHEAGFAIILVSNAPRLRHEDRDRLLSICSRIIRRTNVGFDFGAWKEGIAAIPDLQALDQLVIGNDSVYGPFHYIGEIIDRMSPLEADVWGVTDSWDRRYHLQSYFLLFHGATLRSPAFAAFWNGVRYIQSKEWVIRTYEIGLTEVMLEAGLRIRALFPYRTCAEALVEAITTQDILSGKLDLTRDTYIRMLYRHIVAGRPLNSTHFFWDYLIADMGFPFLKRELLQRNPAQIPLLTFWERVVKDNSLYDTSLITRHLQMRNRNRVY